MSQSAMPKTHSATAPTVKLLIGGQFVESKTTEWRNIINPATQEVLARVPFATKDEVNAAVAAAKDAFKTWRFTPIGTRARIFLKYQQLIRENMADLAATLTIFVFSFAFQNSSFYDPYWSVVPPVIAAAQA